MKNPDRTPKNSDIEEPTQLPAPKVKRRQATSDEVWAIAALITDNTKVAAKRALSASDFMSRDTDVDAVLAAEKVVRRRRTEREIAKPADVASLAQRLESVKRTAVAAVARRMFRHGAAGGHTMYIDFAARASQVAYSVVMDRNWDTYRGQYKGWAANEDHHHITVPSDWRIRVQKRGLAELGGMMTLDAHPLESLEGVQVFVATWASQGRAYAVHVHRGYIAVSGEEHFHAETHEKAVQGLHRKRSSAPRAYFSAYSSSVDEFVKRYSRYSNEVTLDDARSTGSCEYGIRSWCETTGLPYEHGSAPMRDVLDAFRAAPQAEVRRAIVQSVKQQRAMSRLERSCRNACSL